MLLEKNVFGKSSYHNCNLIFDPPPFPPPIPQIPSITKPRYCCPVTNKSFNESSTIVAVKTTGNVYSKQALEVTGSMTDFLTGEPFTRADVVTIQDPRQPRKGVAVALPDAKKARKDDGGVAATAATGAATAGGAAATGAGGEHGGANATSTSSSSVTDGLNIRSATGTLAKVLQQMKGPSTGFFEVPKSLSTRRETEDEKSRAAAAVAAKKVTEKGYARIQTTLGDLNVELFAPDAPRACENFLTLAASGYSELIINDEINPNEITFETCFEKENLLIPAFFVFFFSLPC